MTDPTPTPATTPDPTAGDSGGLDPEAAVRAAIAAAHDAALAAVDRLPGISEQQRQAMRAEIHRRAQAGLPQPLPPVRDDPALATAAAATRDYQARAEQIRADPHMTDLEKAETLDRMHRDLDATLAAAWADLQARRAARLQVIEQLSLPFGDPGPDVRDASPADRAVLLAAWRDAYQDALHATRDARRRTLEEAGRWGDTLGVRAVLTAAEHAGDLDTVRNWIAANRPHLIDLINERFDLRAKLHGHDLGTDLTWTMAAFRMPPPPPERADLARLRAEAATRQHALGAEQRARAAVWAAQGPTRG